VDVTLVGLADGLQTTPRWRTSLWLTWNKDTKHI